MLRSEYFQEEEREEAYGKLFALTGYDVHKAIISSGGRNVTYIMPDGMKPAVIRVSLVTKARQDVLSELLFVDYLRETVHTVCQPIAVQDNLVNEMTVGDKTYYVVLFRKANGRSPFSEEYTPSMYRLFGEKLGELHATSMQATREGFLFKRKQFDELDLFNFNNAILPQYYGQDVVDEMKKCRDAVLSLPKITENYGMLHGDFYDRNLFVDWDIVWVFDFDDCHYGFYWYDIATLFMTPLMGAYAPPEVQKKIGWTQEKMKSYYHAFCVGYKKTNPCAEAFLDKENLILFLKLRLCSVLNIFAIANLPADLRQKLTDQMIQMLQSDLSECF